MVAVENLAVLTLLFRYKSAQKTDRKCVIIIARFICCIKWNIVLRTEQKTANVTAILNIITTVVINTVHVDNNGTHYF